MDSEELEKLGFELGYGFDDWSDPVYFDEVWIGDFYYFHPNDKSIRGFFLPIKGSTRLFTLDQVKEWLLKRNL